MTDKSDFDLEKILGRDSFKGCIDPHPLAVLNEVLQRHDIPLETLCDSLEGIYNCRFQPKTLKSMLDRKKFIPPEVEIRLWNIIYDCIPEERESACRYMEMNLERFKYSMYPFLEADKDLLIEKRDTKSQDHTTVESDSLP